jgi:hypothetical protein
MRCVAGRLESRFQYSNNIVYNNYPWPTPTPEQRERVEEKARAVLTAREKFMAWGARASRPQRSASSPNAPRAQESPDMLESSNVSEVIGETPMTATGTVALPQTTTLADLYDPNTMPRDLLRAHTELDRAVERCYRPEPFRSDRERVEHLFRLYEQLAAPLLPTVPRQRTSARRRTF